jgi:nucleotide-binding universal stress UspA family protein
MSVLDVQTVLVPVDGSEESIEAVEHAVAVARRYDAGLHTLYVLGEEVATALEAEAVTSEAVADQSEAFMDHVYKRAEDLSVTHSMVRGYSPTRLTVHPGEVVLDAAVEVDADFVVMPREPITGGADRVLEKAAAHVLAHADQPVLSV